MALLIGYLFISIIGVVIVMSELLKFSFVSSFIRAICCCNWIRYMKELLHFKKYLVNMIEILMDLTTNPIFSSLTWPPK